MAMAMVLLLLVAAAKMAVDFSHPVALLTRQQCPGCCWVGLCFRDKIPFPPPQITAAVHRPFLPLTESRTIRLLFGTDQKQWQQCG